MISNGETPRDGPRVQRPNEADRDSAIVDRIRRLARQQPYGVLCTQSDGHPYGSLIAFAFTPDLKYAVFGTPQATRKYRLLTECHHVAVVMNNRDEFPDDLGKIEAFTAVGTAREITAPVARASCVTLLAGKHPGLGEFLSAPSTAIFEIEIAQYFYVRHFQEAHQWTPPDSRR
jgi:nitroimidazol reductase NimA-like FMN-containing flavoprotein (pyridoxamine 5'-phosphate oxidase superfamily)